MNDTYSSEHEAGKSFIIGEFKKKMKGLRSVYDDEEFKMIDGDFTHIYYQNLKKLGAERDEKLTVLEEEFQKK